MSLTKSSEATINLTNIQDKLEGLEEINFDDLPQLLGEDYNEVYFRNMELLQSISIDVINSDVLSEIENEGQRKTYAEQVVSSILSQSQLDGITHNLDLYSTSRLSCNDPVRYRNCEQKALDDHERRMAAASITAVVASGLGTPVAGGIAFVGGMIGSGIQYDRDVEYCRQQFCIAQ